MKAERDDDKGEKIIPLRSETKPVDAELDASIRADNAMREAARIVLEEEELKKKADAEKRKRERERKRALKQAEQAEREAERALACCGLEHLTDAGNSKRLVGKFGAVIRYARDTERWYTYQGGKWDSQDQKKIIDYALQTALAIASEIVDVDDAAARKEILRWEQISESSTSLHAMARVAASNDRVKIFEREFDPDPYLLNATNGTINLKDGTLQPHNPADLCSRQCGCAYDAAAHSDEWDAFLKDFVDGNEELLNFLHRACGFTAIGLYDQRIFFYVHGVKGSGKTTFLRAISGALGDYSGVADKESFLVSNKRGARHRPDIVKLAGTRLVVASEMIEGSRFDTAFLKQWSGNDGLVARDLFKGYQDIERRGKIWIGSNVIPKSNSDDDAFFERAAIIPANNARLGPDGVTARINQELGKIFADPTGSRKAILAWIVEGARMYLRDGLKRPALVQYESDEYRKAQNPLAAWIDDRCDVDIEDAGLYDTASALRSSYDDYVTEEYGRSAKPMSAQAFGKYMMQLGFLKDKTRAGRSEGNPVAVWRGVRCRGFVPDVPEKELF